MNRKGMIIINMPTTCFECEFYHESSYDNRYKICGDKFCGIEYMEVNEYCELCSKPDWCPLKELPKEENGDEDLCSFDRGWTAGFNTCLQRINGE